MQKNFCNKLLSLYYVKVYYFGGGGGVDFLTLIRIAHHKSHMALDRKQVAVKGDGTNSRRQIQEDPLGPSKVLWEVLVQKFLRVLAQT